MKAFTPANHILHNPPYCMGEGGAKAPYFEAPERIDRVKKALSSNSAFLIQSATQFGIERVWAVHDSGYLHFLENAYRLWEQGQGELGADYVTPIYTPATFIPRRAGAKVPRSLYGQAGYYGTDTFAPIVSGTFQAAVSSANSALSAADALIKGDRSAFSMSRPPGHHAGKDFSGGFCYLNNAAIAAKYLSQTHRVAILDIDFHAGNGTQDIFFESAEVLTVSIHGDPHDFYPCFMGYEDEIGSGEGRGYHRNFPLPKGVDDQRYLGVLARALGEITKFNPSALVLSAGMDILASDPLGAFELSLNGIDRIGLEIAQLKLPTVIIMEGGYNHEALGEGFLRLLEKFL